MGPFLDSSASPSVQHPSPAPILPHTMPKAAPSQPPPCPCALSLVPFPVIHLDRAMCHSLREGTSSSKLPHSPNSSPLTPPREPVGQAGLKITRPELSVARPSVPVLGPGSLAPTLLCHPHGAGTTVAKAGTAMGTHGTPKMRGGEGEQRHWHTIMQHAGIACAASAPGTLSNASQRSQGSQWGGAGEGGGR